MSKYEAEKQELNKVIIDEIVHSVATLNSDVKALIKCLPYETLHKMLKSNRVSHGTHKKLLLEWNYRDDRNESQPLESIYK